MVKRKPQYVKIKEYIIQNIEDEKYNENEQIIAKNILETSLNYLGIAVANTITNFDPEKVVIGGGVINGGSIVLDTIRRVVGERALKTFVDSCTVEKAVLGGKAGVLGAAALAITEQ